MNTPVEALNPADLWCRAMVLEEEGAYQEAKDLVRLADEKIYTPEYRLCMQRQIEYVIEQLSDWRGPIIDLASGRCQLVEQIISKTSNLVVATDLSPSILKRDRQWFEKARVYDRISLLAFDAQHLPFKDRSIRMMTTHLGLQNIAKSDHVLHELRRVVDGRFLAISAFYPEEDGSNKAAFKKYGLATTFLHRHEAVNAFASAAWQAATMNSCHGRALPTPVGVILKGAMIDLFPAAATTLEWCVIAAT
jgi:hypothetical protein